MMKSGIRAAGIDDGPQAGLTRLVGVVMRPDRVEGVLGARARLDGDDSTEAIRRMLSGRFSSQLRAVFVNGVAVAGFNLVNFVELSRSLGLPVIVCTDNRPHPEEFGRALQKFPGKLRTWREINTPVHRLGRIWYQFAGCSRGEAEQLIRLFQVHSELPEPLRLAHIIATGIELGESKGL